MARILLAEDEESLRELVSRALAMDGHEVVPKSDGAEALGALSRDGGSFDLLLTDIRMPVMDGIQLALSAARDYPALPILLMTGYADQRERANNLQALIHDVIAKPFTLATLCEAVRDALGPKQMHRSRRQRSERARPILPTQAVDPREFADISGDEQQIPLQPIDRPWQAQVPRQKSFSSRSR